MVSYAMFCRRGTDVYFTTEYTEYTEYIEYWETNCRARGAPNPHLHGLSAVEAVVANSRNRVGHSQGNASNHPMS